LRVLVTGASGFVGRHLCEHLESEGDEILPFDPPDLDFIDVRDRNRVITALTASGAEVVYHLAALSHVGASYSNAVDTIRVNVEGTLNVLDACRQAQVARVLIVGSGEEYGRGRGIPFDESAPLMPVSPYGVSKVAAEYLGLQAYLSGGLETVMTRSFNHTGPGQSADFVVPALAHRIAEAERAGRKEIEVGALESVREFNDVRDVVRAYRLLVAKGRPGSIYNVCSGVGHTVGEILRRLIRLSGHQVAVRHDPDLMRKGEPGALVGNASKLESETGWRPRISLDETLAAILEEARSSIKR